MQPRGLHLLLTYKCNASCRHCFLNSGPARPEVFSLDFGLELLESAAAVRSINHIFIEGGEPFLFPSLMESLIKRASSLDLWVGALTNAFWATGPERARKVLGPMAAAGLKSLSISTDGWHEEFVPIDRVLTAAGIGREYGLQTDIMVCADTGRESRDINGMRATGGVPVYAGAVVCKGRAADTLCLDGRETWTGLTGCLEKLARPGRVHIGPEGEVHLCQGLLVGETVNNGRLSEVLSGYSGARHPLVGELLSGGPAALARLARQYGWAPKVGYVDSCHLCFEVRRFLQPVYPAYIGPPGIYS